MKQTLEKILASILNGLIFPFLLYGFQITPWSAPFPYYNAAVVSFSVTFLVYKYRESIAGRGIVKTYLINSLISFLVLIGIAALYFAIIAFMERVI